MNSVIGSSSVMYSNSQYDSDDAKYYRDMLPPLPPKIRHKNSAPHINRTIRKHKPKYQVSVIKWCYVYDIYSNHFFYFVDEENKQFKILR